MENRAAWITAAKATPFVINPAPFPKAGPGEIVVRNLAVAVNHIDYKIQDFGFLVEKYPFILGEDVAGIVEEIGPEVTGFKIGQRIMANCHNLKTGNAANGGFQLYTTVLERFASPIPDSLPFERAVVLPIAISTAAGGLYHKRQLKLPFPSANPAPTGKTILVWGGSSSVGSTVVQLAAASGVRVIATASVHNHELVKSLGASIVIDYKSPNLVDEVTTALTSGPGEFAGIYDAISEADSYSKVGAVLRRIGSTSSIKVVNVLPPQSPPDGFQPSIVFANDILDETNREVATAVWGKFIPQALISGQIKSFPEPFVVGEGLEKIQEGLNILKSGVSAKKVVVKL